jgi:hypothetical protein
MPVGPSVRMRQRSSHWTDFHKIWYLLYFENPWWNFQWLKLRRIAGTLHEDVGIFMIISHWIFLGMTNVSDKAVENIILCSITFFRQLCHLLGTATQDWDDDIIWLMRFEFLVTKATETHTHTHTEYVIFRTFTLHNSYANAPHCYVCTYIACLVKYLFIDILWGLGFSLTQGLHLHVDNTSTSCLAWNSNPQ